MTDEQLASSFSQLFAEMSVQRFLIENLYAIHFAAGDNPDADAAATRTAILEAFGRPAAPAAGASMEAWTVHQFAIEAMENALDRIVERVAERR